MKYLKSIIACVAITLIAPTLAFAQESGYWGYGSMCRIRDCAPGRESSEEFPNINLNIIAPRTSNWTLSEFEGIISEVGPHAESVCMEYAKFICGGIGYSSPNKPIPMTVWCSPPGSKVASQYWNTTTCPPGYTPLGRPYPEWTDYTR